MFGKPLVGSPIAPLAMRTAPMTSRFGCGSGICWPTCCTSGSTINAATVWLMKVATTRIKPAKTMSTLYKLIPSTPVVIDSAMVCNSPEELTDLPSARPPAASYVFSAMWTPVIMLLLGGFTIAAALSKYNNLR